MLLVARERQSAVPGAPVDTLSHCCLRLNRVDAPELTFGRSSMPSAT